MLHTSMSKNVAAHKAPKRQEEEAAVQGKMSTGRTVIWQNRMTIQTSGQMAGASSTFLRTIPPCSGAAHPRTIKRTTDFPTETETETETESARGSRQSETIEHQQIFRNQVNCATRKLNWASRSPHNGLSFCLTVVDTCKILEQDLGRIKAHLDSFGYNTCHRYMIYKMSDLYNSSFQKALEFFQHQITIGHDWVYTKEFDKIARVFTKLGNKSVDTAVNKALLAEIWTLHVNNELNYLKYLKDSPDGHYVAEHAITNIKWLTSGQSPTCYLDLISEQDLYKIRVQIDSLCLEMVNSVNCSDAGKKRENVLHKATDTEMDKRKCHDLIFEQLIAMKNDKSSQTSDDSKINGDHNRICYLEKLLALYRKYNTLVDNPYTQLFAELNRLITQIVDEVRGKLRKGVYDGDQTLKEKLLSLLNDPEIEKCLNRKHENPYLGHIQSQNTVIPDVPKDITTHKQFHDFFNTIFELLQNRSPDQDVMALRKLKQLFDQHGDKLKIIPPHKLSTLQARLAPIANMLFARLYAPILNDYRNKTRKKLPNAMRRDTVMYRHKDKIIELTPYVPYLSSPNRAKFLYAWQSAACFAWFNDLQNLCYQTSFTRNDVDNLLDLKDVAPDLPSYNVGDILIQVLTRLFPFMLQTNPDTALIEKVTKLSEWIDCIGRQIRHNHGISQELYEYNEEWREKYIGKAGEGATTPSSTSAARMPSSVRPGMSGIFPEAFDCHPRMRLQDVPHTRQFSIPCPGLPTPAPCGSFQQSASSIPCRTPDAPSAAESRPIHPP